MIITAGNATSIRLRAVSSLPEEFAGPFTEYADEVSRPGGPLDADTIWACVSSVRQFLAWFTARSAWT